MWSTVDNAGHKPIAGSRLVKWRWALHPGIAWSVSAAVLCWPLAYPRFYACTRVRVHVSGVLQIVLDRDVDKGCLMIRMGVSGWMFLVVPAQLGSPGRRAVKRLCVSVRVPVYACTHIFPAAIHVQKSVTFSSLHHPYTSCVMCFVVVDLSWWTLCRRKLQSRLLKIWR